MRKKAQKCFMFMLAAGQLVWMANAQASIDVNQNLFQLDPGKPLYINVETGQSYSLPAGLDVDIASGWDPSPQGYNSSLHNSALYGTGIGYIVNPLVRVELDVDHRGSFEYQKLQTSGAALGGKTRYFDLSNTTIMANLYLDGGGLSNDLIYRSNSFAIEPFVNAGIGVAFNTVSDFHSVQTNSSSVFSMMSDKTSNALAYQLGAGFMFETAHQVDIGLGYRYLDAGRFSTNNYLLDNPDTGGSGGLAVTPWKGNLKTNEVYANLRYRFG
jgi:opacity protein-like surface antigen